MNCINGHGRMSEQIPGLATCTRCGVQVPVEKEAMPAKKAKASPGKKKVSGAKAGKKR